MNRAVAKATLLWKNTKKQNAPCDVHVGLCGSGELGRKKTAATTRAQGLILEQQLNTVDKELELVDAQVVRLRLITHEVRGGGGAGGGGGRGVGGYGDGGGFKGAGGEGLMGGSRARPASDVIWCRRE